MHGRVKVKTTDEKKAEETKNRIEKEKHFDSLVKAYFENKTQVFASLPAELDPHDAAQIGQAQAMLHECANILRLAPEWFTLWNDRRRILLRFPAAQCSPLPCPALLWQPGELELTVQCLRENPKAYSVWHHREWVLSRFPGADWSAERQLCDQALSQDERNFHCWDHRRFCVRQAGLPLDGELGFSRQKLSDISNFSGWHYRHVLLRSANDNRPAVVDVDMQEELSLVHNAVFTDPSDQSAWLYHRWTLGEVVWPGEPASLCLIVDRVGQRITVLFSQPVDCQLVARGEDGLRAALWMDGVRREDGLGEVWVPADIRLGCCSTETGLLEDEEEPGDGERKTLRYARLFHRALLGGAGSGDTASTDQATYGPLKSQLKVEVTPTWWTGYKRTPLTASVCLEDGQSHGSSALLLPSDCNQSLVLNDLSLMGLDSSGEASHHQLAGHQLKVLQEEVDLLEDLRREEPDNKWVLLTCARLHYTIGLLELLLHHSHRDQSPPTLTQCLQPLDRLGSLDPLRSGFYRDLKSQLITRFLVVQQNLQMKESSSLPSPHECSLDWRRLQLTCVSGDLVGLHSGLVQLDLSHNELSQLPRELGGLLVLRELVVDDNRLVGLRYADTAPNLRLLSARRNRIADFDLFACVLASPRLAVLQLHGNPITRLADFSLLVSRHPAARANHNSLSINYEWNEADPNLG